MNKFFVTFTLLSNKQIKIAEFYGESSYPPQAIINIKPVRIGDKFYHNIDCPEVFTNQSIECEEYELMDITFREIIKDGVARK